MAGYSDLSDYVSDEERDAVCAELARMLRIVPLDRLSPSPASGLPPSRTPAAAGAGESIPTQGASA